MTARGSMKQRAVITRQSDEERLDDFGQFAVGEQVERVTVPCRAWNRSKKHVNDQSKAVVVEDYRAIVPGSHRTESGGWVVGWVQGWVGDSGSEKVTTDVKIGDIVDKITDRLGKIVFSGPLVIEAIIPRFEDQSSLSHLELMLTRHG